MLFAADAAFQHLERRLGGPGPGALPRRTSKTSRRAGRAPQGCIHRRRREDPPYARRRALLSSSNIDAARYEGLKRAEAPNRCMRGSAKPESPCARRLGEPVVISLRRGLSRRRGRADWPGCRVSPSVVTDCVEPPSFWRTTGFTRQTDCEGVSPGELISSGFQQKVASTADARRSHRFRDGPSRLAATSEVVKRRARPRVTPAAHDTAS